MRLERLTTTWKGLNRTNLILLASVLLLALSNLLSIVMASRRELAVVLVPPNLTERTEIFRHDADRAANRRWATYLATLLGNVQPDNVEFVRAAVADMISTRIYTETMQALAREVEDIKRDRVSFNFEPREIVYDEASQTWYVTGNSMARGPGQEHPEIQARTYEIRLVTQDFRPVVTWINTYGGGPRLPGQPGTPSAGAPS